MKALDPIHKESKTPQEPSLLKKAFLALQQMQAKLDASERRAKEPIAIIGLGCRFPGGVVNGETFWELLCEGREAISPVPPERWNIDDWYHPDPEQPGKMTSRSGGFIDQVDKFDAAFFGIAPREAASMDPQQRLALEVAWEALENAGCAPDKLRGTKTGVFLGIANYDYSQLQLQAEDSELFNAHYGTGVAHSAASGRISYLLGLEGPSVSLDTACSSSLVAVHLACQSLRVGDCSLALAGGVNLILAPETTALLSRAGMLAPDGRCKTFDESANGFVRGEGCGFVALKTLSQAQADGNRILAVIRGAAVNQDGASSSLTAPNGPSQVNLMRQAVANAGLQPGQISYIEAHGTGTALGDPIELQALGVVYGASRPKGDLLTVGSLKTNIGHLEAAAGVAGLIKTVLALQHRQIPAHLHLTRPTSHVRWDELRLAVPLKLTEWETAPEAAEDTRVAAVSSFGFSGTNAHVVVAEAPPSNFARGETGWPLQILTASAKSKTALMRVVGQYREYIEKHPAADLRDVCFTANTGRSHFQYRACFVASDSEAMKQQLAAFEAPAECGSKDAQRIGFLFTGQGSQYAGMGRELYESAPVFREALERCAAAWKEETGESLIKVLYPAEGEASRMGEARCAQPVLFAFEYALAELWRSWGVEPGVLLGHSLGEYVAAVVAGVFSLEDGLRLVCARARLMDRLTVPGAMRAIGASAERVEAEIRGLEREVSIAAVSIAAINGPESVVLSGAAETVARIAGRLEAEGVRTRPLEVTHAFHSPLLEPILEEFEACARQVRYHAPRIRIISNVTGKAARAEEIATAGYWRRHMRQAVLFHAGLQTALETGYDAFIEMGPQPHLLSLAKSAYSSPDLLWLPSARRGRSAWLDLLAAVQSLYGLGAEINWKALHGKLGRLTTLPSYPFERQRHWFPQRDSFQKNAAKLPTSATPSAQVHPLLGPRLHSPLAEIQFQSQIGPNQPAYLGDHVVAGARVVPAAAYLEMALSAAHIVTGESRSIRTAAFLRPCIFDGPRILQCVFREGESGSSFEIYSRAEESKSDWVLHATGETSMRITGEDPDEALDAIRKRCAEEEGVSDFYRVFEEHDLLLKNSFRPVSRIFRGLGEALVEFEFFADASADAGPYQIHPVALDGCIQAVAAAVLATSSAEKDAVYLPAALEELYLSGDPRKLTLAYAKVRGGNGEPLTADVQGFDRSGNLLLSATGLVLRPLRQERQDASEADSIVSSFYEVEWTPVERQALDAAALIPGIQGVCVLFGGGNMVRSLSAAFSANGVLCATIQQGEAHADISISGGDLQFPFDRAEPSCYETLLDAIRQRAATPVSDVVYLAPPEVVDAFHLQPERLMELEAGTLGEALQIVQAIVRTGLEKAPRLWLITKGAQGPSLSNIPQSALWGFGRAVALEYPEMRVVRIDLDPSRDTDGKELLQCMAVAGPEDELVVRGREIYVPRLRPAAELKRQRAPEAVNAQLALVEAGTIEGIEVVPVSRREPGPGEVEIRVLAAGLNFRDVLNVLGMYKGKVGPLGGECAGVVVKTGAGVESLKPGDEVVAVGQGCLARFLTTRADLAWPKPAHLSFEAAVTVPIAFLTARYALESIAGMKAGDRVLIHAGAGGVGLAAIQLAQKAGAIVFATAGSEKKRAYLTSIGVDHVMDSRSLHFAREIQEITRGQGVDIVLNSLAGQFVDAGIDVLAPGGRFVELGVADIRSSEWVAGVRPDVSYHPMNLAPALEAGDAFICEMLSSVLNQFELGALQALPREIFSMEKARDAFRYMAQARHIGKVVVCPAEANEAAGIRNDGAYLVTGGMSGLGLAVAEWLGRRGAAQVIVIGRRLPGTDAAEIFSKMSAAGTLVSVCQGDVANEAELSAAIHCAERFPLRGVFHCAAVLDDGSLLQQDWDRFRRVLAPKLEGVCNLHRLTTDSPLDHFVLFSSIVSVLGSRGQTNYASANAFLDAMAQYRRSRGLPALSVNWGPWSETGVAVRRHVVERGSQIGLRGVSTLDGLRALEILIASARAQIMVAPVDWSTWFAGSGSESNRQLLSELRTGRQIQISEKALHQKNPSWLPQLEAAAPARRQSLLMQLLEERVQATLGLSQAQEIDPAQPLQELGLDSLLSIELRNSLSTSLHRGLPATLLFNYPTLDALTGYILQNFFRDAAPTAVKRNVDAARSSLVDDIEALSDEEVDRLLSARAVGGVQ